MPQITLFSRGFISAARVSRTAWETASQTGALSHIDYERILELSRIYALQDRYEEQSRSVGQLIYGQVLSGGGFSLVRNYRNLSSLIMTFVYREKELVDVYGRASGEPPPTRDRAASRARRG